jgi:hypothetical protein
LKRFFSFQKKGAKSIPFKENREGVKEEEDSPQENCKGFQGSEKNELPKD